MLIRLENGDYVNADHILMINRFSEIKWVAAFDGQIERGSNMMVITAADKDKIVGAMQQPKTGGRA